MKRRRKLLGLFGGSFNPIHLGHLHLAESVMQTMKLDGIVLMPAGEAPHKSTAAYAPAEHRLAMCRLAAESIPGMTVSDLEIRKEGKSYTVDTLRMLREQQPDVRWTLLIGSDMLLTFDAWREWQNILKLARLCAVSRSRGDRPQLEAKAAALAADCPGAEIVVADTEALPLSSTEIREMLQKNADCSCVLPENVVEYIYRNGLYGCTANRREKHGQG